MNVCTKDKPYKEGDPLPVVHPDADIVYSEPDYDKYKCPYCGLRFTVTIPE